MVYMYMHILSMSMRGTWITRMSDNNNKKASKSSSTAAIMTLIAINPCNNFQGWDSSPVEEAYIFLTRNSLSTPSSSNSLYRLKKRLRLLDESRDAAATGLLRLDNNQIAQPDRALHYSLNTSSIIEKLGLWGIWTPQPLPYQGNATTTATTTTTAVAGKGNNNSNSNSNSNGKGNAPISCPKR